MGFPPAPGSQEMLLADVSEASLGRFFFLLAADLCLVSLSDPAPAQPGHTSPWRASEPPPPVAVAFIRVLSELLFPLSERIKHLPFIFHNCSWFPPRVLLALSDAQGGSTFLFTSGGLEWEGKALVYSGS